MPLAEVHLRVQTNRVLGTVTASITHDAWPRRDFSLILLPYVAAETIASAAVHLRQVASTLAHSHTVYDNVLQSYSLYALGIGFGDSCHASRFWAGEKREETCSEKANLRNGALAGGGLPKPVASAVSDWSR